MYAYKITVYIMIFSVIPAFVGMLALALLPHEGHLWTRWGMYLMTIIGNIAGPCKMHCALKFRRRYC